MLLIKIIAPLLLLGLQVSLKFLVGRQIEKRHYLELICELPTNVIFLSSSFSLVLLFINNPIENMTVIYFIAILIISIIVVFIFRITKNILDLTMTVKNILWATILILFNYLVSISILYIISKEILSTNNSISQSLSNQKNISSDTKKSLKQDTLKIK